MAKPASILGLVLAPEIRAWRGGQPLWKVFWVYGVATSGGIGALYFGAMASGQTALRQALLIVLAVYTAWIVISVWRCADNASEPRWGRSRAS